MSRQWFSHTQSCRFTSFQKHTQVLFWFLDTPLRQFLLFFIILQGTTRATGVSNFSRAILMVSLNFLSSVLQTYKLCGQAPSAREGRFQAKNFLANLGVSIAQIWIYFSTSSSLAASLPVFRDTSSQCVSITLLTYPNQAAVGSFGASRSSKTFPDVRYKFRVSRCELSTKTRNSHLELLAVARSSKSLESFREFTLSF